MVGGKPANPNPLPQSRLKPYDTSLDRRNVRQESLQRSGAPSRNQGPQGQDLQRSASNRAVSRPQQNGAPPRSQNLTPRSQNVTPRTQDSTPRSQNITPRNTQSTAPRSQNVTPRMQNGAPTNLHAPQPRPHQIPPNQKTKGLLPRVQIKSPNKNANMEPGYRYGQNGLGPRLNPEKKAPLPTDLESLHVHFPAPSQIANTLNGDEIMMYDDDERRRRKRRRGQMCIALVIVLVLVGMASVGIAVYFAGKICFLFLMGM